MNPQPLENVERPERAAAPPFFPLRLTPRGFNPAAARCNDPRKGNARTATASKVRSAPDGARTPSPPRSSTKGKEISRKELE